MSGERPFGPEAMNIGAQDQPETVGTTTPPEGEEQLVVLLDESTPPEESKLVELLPEEETAMPLVEPVGPLITTSPKDGTVKLSYPEQEK